MHPTGRTGSRQARTTWCLALGGEDALGFVASPHFLGESGAARDDLLLAHTVGAQMIVRVKARAIFPNCPRYIPRMELAEESPYVPRSGEEPVEPAWKSFPDFAPFIQPRQPTAR